MRKRSKIRITQDILPWARVTLLDDDKINIFFKTAEQGFEGNRRKAQTTLYNYHKKIETAGLLLNFLFKDQRLLAADSNYNYQFSYHNSKLKPQFGSSKARNFCLFLGKGRTFNRKYFISRPVFRKFMKAGVISGLQKK